MFKQPQQAIIESGGVGTTLSSVSRFAVDAGDERRRSGTGIVTPTSQSFDHRVETYRCHVSQNLVRTCYGISKGSIAWRGIERIEHGAMDEAPNTVSGTAALIHERIGKNGSNKLALRV
jgi:hypothetical protein